MSCSLFILAKLAAQVLEKFFYPVDCSLRATLKCTKLLAMSAEIFIKLK